LVRELLPKLTKVALLVRESSPETAPGVKELAEAGGLMAYGPSFDELYRRAASHVYKILQGVNVADLPIEQPVKFDFVLNMRTAKELGLTIPPSLLALADEVIE
jgi:putative ABC transport system substrate-binding protein